MKHIPLLLLGLLCFPSPPAFASDGIRKESISISDRNRTYYVFVAENLTSSRPVPLLVTLHGSGRNGLSLVEKWKDIAIQEEIIVVGPDAEDLKVWGAPQDGPDFLHDLIEGLKAKYPINPRRVYLFGHSSGAVFSMIMALMESEYFAAAAVHAGAFREPQEYLVIDNARRKIPLAIFVGTQDAFFPLTAVRATRDALRSRGFPVELTEIPGHDHWYYDLAPKINRSAWEFLSKYELETDPQYHQYKFKQ